VKSFLQYLLEQNTESPAPYGALKITHSDGRTQWIVGVHHGKQVNIKDPELKRSIAEHGKEHGHWYEGPGNDTDITQSEFGLKTSKDYRGGWDEDWARTFSKNGIQPHHLGLISGNVDINWEQGIGEHFQDPKQTVFDGILSFYQKNSSKLFNGARITSEHVKKYLQANGPGTDVDWLHEAQTTPATQGKKFLKRIERIAWPEDWNTKSRTTGPERMADRASTERNRHILGMGSGVFWAGAGHLLQIEELLKKDGTDYKLYGGEQAHE